MRWCRCCEGSGNASETFSEMSFLIASKDANNSGVCLSLPLDLPDEAVNGAIKSARLFQKDQQKFTMPMKDCSSVIVLGNCSWRIGLILSGLGRMPEEAMT